MWLHQIHSRFIILFFIQKQYCLISTIIGPVLFHYIHILGMLMVWTIIKLTHATMIWCDHASTIIYKLMMCQCISKYYVSNHWWWETRQRVIFSGILQITHYFLKHTLRIHQYSRVGSMHAPRKKLKL